MTWCLLALLLMYRGMVRPFLIGNCKFHPTCSQYAVEAVQLHGPLRGPWLAVRRVLRCQPFGRGGYDPVPEPQERPSPPQKS